jgi:hypothetical protein
MNVAGLADIEDSLKWAIITGEYGTHGTIVHRLKPRRE